jgi:CRISPR/Cas system-associated exonuclease Cas4 (RecB family)
MSDPDPLPPPIFTPEHRLRDYIEAHKFVPREPGKKSGWYAASKLGDCIRANYYRFIEMLPEPEDPQFVTERAPIGKAWERIVLDWFRNAKVLTPDHEQVSVADPELRLKGIMDALIEDEGILAPVEVKSIDGMNSNDNYGIWRSRPKPDAYLQLQAYMMMRKAGHGYLVYSSTQDVGDWWMWRTETDPATQRWIRDRLSTLEIYRGLGGPPPRPVKSPSDWKKCGWCAFKKPCWEAKQ